jgi:peptidoglycan hydrolase-like protein with peptidoglycan-binding domain
MVAAWMTPTEEARAVRVAALRAGCRVESIGVRATSLGERAAGHVVCRDGWSAARMLVGLAAADARTAGARDLALALRRAGDGDDEFARAVHAYVKDRVRFVREPGEVFAGASYTLGAEGGDCDDHARLVFAVVRAGGVPARLAFLGRRGASGPSHVCAQAFVSGAWRWLETTVDAEYDEHPYAAAMRLGILSARSDIAEETRAMSEKDLPPIPPGFLDREPEDVVTRDADALRKLGFLSGECFPTCASDDAFRAAVAEFQRSRGLAIDGLPGPATHAALARAIGELGDTMGAVTATKRTDYLSDEFFAKVAEMARDFRAKGARVTGEDFLAVWLSESGCNPARRGNKGPKGERFDLEFGGLNMMDHVARAGTGFAGTLDDFLALSDVDQLVFVRRFYERNVAAFAHGDFAALADVGSLYLMNFLPAYMPHAGDPSFVLARKGGLNDAADKRSADWYDANAGVDVEHKGWIQVSDMKRFAVKAQSDDPAKWAELRARMAATGETPPSTVPSGSGGTAAVVAVLALLAAAGGYAAWHYGVIG